MIKIKKLGMMAAFLGLLVCFANNIQAQSGGTIVTNVYTAPGGNGLPEIQLTLTQYQSTTGPDLIALDIVTSDQETSVHGIRVRTSGLTETAIADTYSTSFLAEGTHMLEIAARDYDRNVNFLRIPVTDN